MLRRKDPVKRAIWIAVFIVSLVAIWSLTLQSKIIIASAKLNTLDVSWRSIERSFGGVLSNQTELSRLERNLSALQQLKTNRFLWGSFLNTLQQTVVEDVAVSRLKADQTYMQTEGTPDRTNETRIMRGKPAVAIERITVTIEARDFTPNSVGHIRFKEALANSALFQGSVQKTNVLLIGLAAPTADTFSPSGMAVPFSLQCFFPEKERALK